MGEKFYSKKKDEKNDVPGPGEYEPTLTSTY